MITLRDVKHAMTYGSMMAETIQVGPYAIEFSNDDSAENPYDNDEGMTPAIWFYGGWNGDYSEYGDSNLESFFDKMPLHWISRNWRAIASILDIAESDHDKEARENAAYNKAGLSETRKELFAEYLNDMKSDLWGRAIDYLEALRSLYTLAGYPAETFQRNGYMQGDSIRGLIVMTPAWIERVGFTAGAAAEQCKKDMAGQADIYGAWAWGDVYGYTVTDSCGDEVGSCHGFYTSDLVESGLWDNLQSDIECHESNLAKVKLGKVKTWIKARVPLAIRAEKLATLQC